MIDFINKRVKVIKGRDKDKFGMILEIIDISADGTPVGFLIELNNGKINNYSYEDFQLLTEIHRDKGGKVNI